MESNLEASNDSPILDPETGLEIADDLGLDDGTVEVADIEIDYDPASGVLTLSTALGSATGRPSSSGKTTVLATTGGNKGTLIPGMGEVFIGVNVYRK